MDPTRRKALQSIGCLTIAGLAGCNIAGSEADADRSPTAATPERTATDRPTETEATATEAVMDFEVNPAEIHPRLVEATSVGDEEVLIGLRLEDSTLPFTTEVYEAPDDAAIQATETYDTQDLGAISLLPDDPRALSTVDTENEDVHYGTTTVGEPLMVTLVARHDGERMEWSAWGRSGHPVAGHEGALDVDCYCGGDIYTAPAGGSWARVIQVTPTEEVDPGTTIVLNWTSSPLI